MTGQSKHMTSITSLANRSATSVKAGDE